MAHLIESAKGFFNDITQEDRAIWYMWPVFHKDMLVIMCATARVLIFDRVFNIIGYYMGY